MPRTWTCDAISAACRAERGDCIERGIEIGMRVPTPIAESHHPNSARTFQQNQSFRAFKERSRHWSMNPPIAELAIKPIRKAKPAELLIDSRRL